MRKKHRLSTIFSLFFDPKIPLLFLIGTFVTAVGGNAAFSFVLKELGGDTSQNYLKILLFSILGLIFIVVVIKVVLSKITQSGSSEPSPAFDIPRKGIIYTVGNQTSTILFSHENQKPQFVGFICTKMSETLVAGLIESMEIGEDNYQKKIVDPQDVIENETETQKLANWMLSKGLKSSDIVVDVTGGMTTMSVGAFSMAEKIKIDTQYIKSQYDGTKPIGPVSGVIVRKYTNV